VVFGNEILINIDQNGGIPYLFCGLFVYSIQYTVARHNKILRKAVSLLYIMLAGRTSTEYILNI